MKYNAKKYAQALNNALLVANGDDKNTSIICERFISILKSHNSLSLWPEISRQLSLIQRKNNQLQKIEVTSARNLSDMQIRKIEQAFSEKARFTYNIEESLIGGLILTINDELKIDGSLLNKANKLF